MNNLNFKNIKDILSRDEMRQIKGGSGGTCGFKVTHNGVTLVQCGVSYSLAMHYYNSYGGRWCCDSCPSSTYCG